MLHKQGRSTAHRVRSYPQQIVQRCCVAVIMRPAGAHTGGAGQEALQSLPLLPNGAFDRFLHNFTVASCGRAAGAGRDLVGVGKSFTHCLPCADRRSQLEWHAKLRRASSGIGRREQEQEQETRPGIYTVG